MGINFLYIYEEGGTTGSGFKGNSGFIDLAQNKKHNGTTGPHEIGHMLGFRSTESDETHFLTEKNGIMPMMYTGNSDVGKRKVTRDDINGLNLTSGLIGYPNRKSKAIGEQCNNVIIKNREDLENYDTH